MIRNILALHRALRWLCAHRTGTRRSLEINHDRHGWIVTAWPDITRPAALPIRSESLREALEAAIAAPASSL